LARHGLCLLTAPRRRNELLVLTGLAAAFLLSVAFAESGLAKNTKPTFDLLFTLAGMTFLESSPFVGAIHNGVPDNYLGPAATGTFIIILTLVSVLGFLVTARPDRGDQCKYIGLIFFGAATTLLITLGRHQYGAGQLANSRYGTAMLPAALGLWGCMCLAACNRPTKLSLAGIALYAVTVICLVMTDDQAARQAPGYAGRSTPVALRK
jgi:hypothetical protein